MKDMKKTILTFFLVVGVICSSYAQMEPLKTGLKNVLNTASQEYSEKNHGYMIYVTDNEVVSFQIVHGALIKATKTDKDKFHYSINFPFEDDLETLEKFKKMNLFKEFKKYEFDGIQCYALSMGDNPDKAYATTTKILQELFGYDENASLEFEIHGLGPLAVD